MARRVSALTSPSQRLIATVATPIQMADAYATLANHGLLLQPSIVKNIYAPLTPDAGPAVDVVSAPRGTHLSLVEVNPEAPIEPAATAEPAEPAASEPAAATDEESS